MNIMIANESRLLAEGVSMIIKSSYSDAHILVTDSAKDVIRNLNSPTNNPWQVILIDTQLSKLISPKRLHRLIPDTKVCLFNSNKYVKTCDEHLKTGFNGVLTESSSSGELKQAIKVLLSGRNFFPEDSNPHSKGFFRIAQKSKKKSLITHREQEIISLIALGLSNKEIARHCELAETTVKRHISNIFKKLGVKNRVEASRLAKEHGLLR